MKTFLKSLSDADLATLHSEVTKEYRRRKRIRKANSAWTSGPGLEHVLRASLKKKEKSSGR